MTHNSFDVAIVGSGCAGSLLAWILARHGIGTLLIDQGQHPRFAIGESSTPLADFLIEQIDYEFDLRQLGPLARWGTWKSSYPQLDVGKKRGFSYFGHPAESRYTDDAAHSQSLLVAASSHDHVSDTHWMRSDIDQWLCSRAIDCGVRYWDNTIVNGLQHDAGGWTLAVSRQEASARLSARWLVDATGSGALVMQANHIARCDDQLLTRTGSLFGHFTSVQAMDDWLHQHGYATAQDPFSSDDAAQHHVLQDGWMWMLRFDSGITSVGITRPAQLWRSEGLVQRDRNLAWQAQLTKYPTLSDLMQQARLINPRVSDEPQLGWIPRISRLWSQAAGQDWLALPGTVGVIDPLHSTGLAHTLSGVRRAAHILLNPDTQTAQRDLQAYSRDIVDEVRWIDRLVSICYAGLPDFQLFTAACTFYFLAAVACEKELRDTGRMQHGFLGAKQSQWQALVTQTATALASGVPHHSQIAKAQFMDQLRRDIEPWNTIGLLDPRFHNRYMRTSTKE